MGSLFCLFVSCGLVWCKKAHKPLIKHFSCRRRPLTKTGLKELYLYAHIILKLCFSIFKWTLHHHKTWIFPNYSCSWNTRTSGNKKKRCILFIWPLFNRIGLVMLFRSNSWSKCQHNYVTRTTRTNISRRENHDFKAFKVVKVFSRDWNWTVCSSQLWTERVLCWMAAPVL